MVSIFKYLIFNILAYPGQSTGGRWSCGCLCMCVTVWMSLWPRPVWLDRELLRIYWNVTIQSIIRTQFGFWSQSKCNYDSPVGATCQVCSGGRYSERGPDSAESLTVMRDVAVDGPSSNQECCLVDTVLTRSAVWWTHSVDEECCPVDTVLTRSAVWWTLSVDEVPSMSSTWGSRRHRWRRGCQYGHRPLTSFVTELRSPSNTDKLLTHWSSRRRAAADVDPSWNLLTWRALRSTLLAMLLCFCLLF